MKAIVVTMPGGPEVLQLQDVPDPQPGPDDVLIEIVAAGVNRADLLQRQGFYDPLPGGPPYPGLECSGRVVELGEQATGWSVGEPVCALLGGGGYAQRVAAPAGHVLPVPEGLDLVAAAALPEAACTVWSNVFMLAGLREGETLLVHGGSSGIGTFAIQLATAFGARVAVTSGSAAKLERCRQLGAEIAINYRTEDFVAGIKEGTGGRGADVILDIMGASYLARNIEALAPAGRLAVIGLQGGRRAELDLGALMGKRAAILSTGLRARPTPEKAAIVASVRKHVWPLIADGRIRPVVDRVLPITEAAQAHRVLEAGEHFGKIVLAVAPTADPAG
ncbi:MAG TPA: NAD(P)H-quinone oxidoreductase [Actinomycetes bacterium]|jgi:putative PIG3 family NAD(P)H quinone oxidoreductase|nr:NAD(P)H-quinone oxidoreductase [Actinomycetes bacterium]